MYKKLFGLIIVALSICNASAQKISGKLQLPQGDTVAVLVHLENSITQEAGGQTIDFKVAGSASHYFTITNSTEDNATLHHGVKHIDFHFDGMGQKMHFDSDNPKDLKGMVGKPMQEILAKQYDIIIDPTGKTLLTKPEKLEHPEVDERMMVITNMLKDLTNVAFPPEKNSPSFFSVLPKQEVAVGDTWNETTTTSTDQSVTTYTLKDIQDSVVLVSYITKSTVNLKSTIMGVEANTSLSTTIEGLITVDKQTGIIRSKTGTGNSTGKVDAMGMSMPITARSTIAIEVQRVPGS